MKVLPRRRRTVLLNCLLAAALATGAGVAYATVGESSASGKSAGTRTATVQRGTVTATVSGSGSLVSPSDAALNFTTGGTLTEVDVKAGDHVTAGEVLAKVDPTSAQQTLDQAEAQLTSAEANLTAVENGESTSQSGGAQNSQSSQNGGGSQGSGTGSGNSGGSGGTSRSSQPSAQPSASASPRPSASADASPRPSASADASASATATRTPHAVNAAWIQAASATPSVNAAQLAQAQAQLVSAQNAVTAAQKAVDGTVLRASVSGTVASVGGKVGDTVSGSGGSGSGGSSSGSGNGGSGGSTGTGSGSLSGFVVITNPTGMEVTADFSESDALKLKSGQAATVTLNADTSRTLNAKLVSVSSLPVSSSGGGGSSSSAVQYAATLQLTGDTSDLRTGLSASVQVTTGEADNALWVPTSAVTGTGGNASVTVVDANGTTHRQQVTTGVQGDTEVQIVSGLTEGQRVQLTLVASSGNNGFPAGGFPGLGGGGFTGGGRLRSGTGGGGRG